MKFFKSFILCCSFAIIFTMFGGEVRSQSQVVGSDLPDYKNWEQTADKIEQVIVAEEVPSKDLDALRETLSEWRTLFSIGKELNSQRIIRINNQLSALGTKSEGTEDASLEISERRRVLNEQLNLSMIPVIRATEAFVRSNGLIVEVDEILRSRQTNQILKLGPSPLNIGSWGSPVTEALSIVKTISAEVSRSFSDKASRAKIWDKFPATIAFAIIGIFIIYAASGWISKVNTSFGPYLSERPALGRLTELLFSIIKVVISIGGFYLLKSALDSSQLFGNMGQQVVGMIFCIIIAVYLAGWLGERLFNINYNNETSLTYLNEDKVGFAILSSYILGFLYGLEFFVNNLGGSGYFTDTSVAILSFIIISISGIILFRLISSISSQLLSERIKDSGLEQSSVALCVLVLRLGLLVCFVSPILSLIGYSYAGNVILFSTLLTFGLAGLVLIVQRTLRDIFSTLIGETEAVKGLVPTLLGLGAIIAAAPFLALIWGARVSDLGEIWSLISNGFQMGESRITPSDLIKFIIIFVIGYLLTRAIQNTLKSQVLPKTKLDAGGQNAVVDGVGYLGIFLAAVIAISTAGIDLSSLAIVAGALSVGIGFGLQTIVSNFVSGIILLIERPITQGDWIEVNGTMGVVKDISVRATVIQTFDRKDVIVPNSDLISGAVTNWTKGNLTGRIILSVGVAYGTDTQKVTRILEEVALEHPMVSDKNPPSVYFLNFGGDALEFEIRIVLQDVNFSLSVKSEINHRIAERFAEEGIEIPFAQRDIWLRNPEALTGENSDTKLEKKVETPKLIKIKKRKVDLPDTDADGGGE